MRTINYDKRSVDSIFDFALTLTGKTLRDFLTPEEQAEVNNDTKNKGRLGNLVEKYYFQIKPGSSPLPDFPDAGLELKTAAVIPSSGRKRKGPLPITPSAYQAKERLKLAKINYTKVVNEEWHGNSLFAKCATILLLLSLYDASKELIDREFIANPILWTLSGRDVEFIMNDWLTITNKIRAGKAHELSGSDTYYLEACTSGKGKMVRQPKSDELAKERSFAFKASFVDASFLINSKFVNKLVPILKEHEMPASLEDIVLERVKAYQGMTDQEIAQQLGYTLSKAKQHLALLSYEMLGIGNKKSEEFVKAGIEIKAVNLNPNGTPSQDISFPAFSYMSIVNEEWEDSTFKQKIDTKTLFMIFQTVDGVTSFCKACFWTMPPEDIDEAHRVWEETKKRVANGNAVNLPLKGFSFVSHVRNHSANSRPETHIPSPKNGKLAVKGFWLNALYIKDQLRTLLD